MIRRYHDCILYRPLSNVALPFRKFAAGESSDGDVCSGCTGIFRNRTYFLRTRALGASRRGACGMCRVEFKLGSHPDRS